MKQRDQARAMRNAMLDAAEVAFASRGFHATKMRDVARDVGVTQPLIHHYFGTKDALFAAVVQRVVERYEVAQADQWERDGSDVRFFTEGIRTLFDFLGRHRQAVRLMWWARLEDRMPDVPRGHALDARVRQKFAQAKAAGVLRDDVSIEVALLMVDSVVRGFWDRVDHMPVLREHAPGLVDGLLRALLVGLLSDRALDEARQVLDEHASADGSC
ncbi:MAG: TetR family transcriptional regulator [Myxococcota bacterium]